MSREIPFEKDEICDYCGKIGAYDFMGDFCCAECMAIIFTPLDEDEPLIGYTGEEED